jgi:DNA replication and repair protein RecF
MRTVRSPEQSDETFYSFTSVEDGVRPLSVTSLSLHHFRNYSEARLEVTPEPVVLTGKNGAGKTNILEALSLLTPGRGLRRARISEIDNYQSSGAPWTVAATVNGMQGEAKLGTGRDMANPDQPDKRITKVDGKETRAQAELARHLAMIWLTPQMEQLFNEGTSAGRKFLDRLVYSFDAEHASRVNEYEYAMRERNRLLQTGGRDAIWLDALEQTMAETASAIGQARLHTASNINAAITASTLSFPKAQISVHGFVESRLLGGDPAVRVEDSLKETLAAGRVQDAAAGRALAGSHRSEMRVRHSEKGLSAESCSTGEQKALLLSIVLAQAKAAGAWKGTVPVILLDEVIAHLDTIRRLELFEEICQIGAQVWMTGTDEKLFADLKEKAQYFQVDNGHIKNINL